MPSPKGRSVLTAKGHPAIFHLALAVCPAVTGVTPPLRIESEYDLCE